MDFPIRVIGAALLAGAAAGVLGAHEVAGLVVVALCALAAVSLRRGATRRTWTLAAAGAATLLGFVRGVDESSVAAPAAVQDLACVEAVVTRAPDLHEGRGAHAEREAVLRASFDPTIAREVEVRIRARAEETLPALLPGDRLRLVGSMEPIRAPTNPGERDRRTELARQGVCGMFCVPTARAAADLGNANYGWTTAVCRGGEIGRRALLERIEEACGGPGPPSALLGCLLLGDQSPLDQDTADAFRDSGTAHLLSVSGLHVVLLAAAARALARRAAPRRVRRRGGLGAMLVLLFVYCALCRFVTPVVRAAVFLAVAEIARAAGRRPSPLDTLAAAAAIVVAVDPAQVLDPSFQLSFAAVAGLALLARPFREALFPSLALYRKFPDAIPAWRLRLYGAFATAFSTSLAATTATAPILALVFCRLQPIAAISNLGAVPIAALLVPIAAALAVVGGTLVWVTAPLAAAGTALLRCTVGLAASLPGAVVDVGPPGGVVLVLSIAALCVAARVASRRPRRALAAAAVSWGVLAAPASAFAARGPPEIVALDVGHGLCVLARSPAGGDVLFDAGGHVPGIGRFTIVPALRALGVRRLEAVFVSHQDADHCCAMPEVLDAFTIGEVCVSSGFGADPEPRRVVALCRERAVPVRVVARGDVWGRRGIDVHILSPCADVVAQSDNEASLVAHVTLRDGDRVLTAVVPGDVEGAPLVALTDDATLPRAQVLVLPHHGRGDPDVQMALARRLAAEVLVASTSAGAPMAVPAALVTGSVGAVRVRLGAAPAAFPWPP